VRVFLERFFLKNRTEDQKTIRELREQLAASKLETQEERKAKEEERKAKEEERKAKEEEKKAKEEAQKTIDDNFKSILDHGLPPMNDEGHGSKSSTSVPTEQQHRSATLIPSDITCLIAEIRNNLTKKGTYTLWTLLNSIEREKFSYGSETDVRSLVNLLMNDVAAALRPLLGDVQITFSAELSTFGDKGDLWVLLLNGVVVGVIEVKKPGTEAMKAPTIIGECFDYMCDIRGFDGLDHVFCILTTYQQWRILWLKDTNDAAKSVIIPEQPEQPAVKLQCFQQLFEDSLPAWPGSAAGDSTSVVARDQTPTKLTAIRGEESRSKFEPTKKGPKREVFGSPVLNWNDPKLVDILASVVLKMVRSPATKLEKIVDLDRQYRLVKEDTWVWTTMKKEFELTFGALPLQSTKNLLLLLPLGHGVNGSAWLAASEESGRVCVAKFLASPGTGDSEVDQWNHIYFDDKKVARVMKLNKKEAVIMPFAKMCTGSVKDQQDDVKDLAVKAIEHFVSKGRQHNDLRWNHVGLVQDRGKTKAVLIDLGNVSEVPQNNEDAKKSMLAALGLS